MSHAGRGKKEDRQRDNFHRKLPCSLAKKEDKAAGRFIPRSASQFSSCLPAVHEPLDLAQRGAQPAVKITGQVRRSACRDPGIRTGKRPQRSLHASFGADSEYAAARE
jgi:hypothetical protein